LRSARVGFACGYKTANAIRATSVCRYDDWRRADDDWEGAGNWRLERRGFCTVERALYKAERMGIRRARIVSAGRYEILMRGRGRFGQRVAVAFGRDRRCSVRD
jgi:hypothetical protein